MTMLSDTGQNNTGQNNTGQNDTGQGETGQGDTGQGDTEQLLDGLCTLAAAPLSDDLAMVARLRFLDWLGCVLAGAASEGARTLPLLEAGGDGPAPVPGTGRRSAPLTAALVNGMHSHVVELDDGHRYGITHAGGPLIAALLAVAHDPRMTPDSFLRGIIVGYEAALRVAIACQPDAKLNGWHGSGVFGTLGAAMGVGAALGYDRSAMNAALAAAATSASGMVRAFATGSELKPYNAGQPAMAGLAAAQVADAGFPGPPGILDGPHGLVQMLRGSPADGAAFHVAAPWCIETVYLKPYASCRYCHAPVEAALALRSKHGLTPEDITAIRVRTYHLAVTGHDHTEIDGPYSARLGIPYCVGAALATGEAGMSAFAPEALSDAQTLRLMRATDVREDPEMTALVPRRRPAALEIDLSSGQTVSARIDLPLGEPEVPLDAAALTAKFTDLAVFAGLAPARAGALAAEILDPASDPRDAVQGGAAAMPDLFKDALDNPRLRLKEQVAAFRAIVLDGARQKRRAGRRLYARLQRGKNKPLLRDFLLAFNAYDTDYNHIRYSGDGARHAASFRVAMTTRTRRMKTQGRDSCPEWMIWDKGEGARFADAMGVRRAARQGGGPRAGLCFGPGIVIKPRNESQAIGIYLVFSEDRIVDARTNETFAGYATLAGRIQDDLVSGRVRDDDWIVEELLTNHKLPTGHARDWKFYSFYGEMPLISVTERIPGGAMCWIDLEGQKKNLGFSLDHFVLKPPPIDAGLLATARDLSLAIPAPFLRIDLLETGDGPALGEFTARPFYWHRFGRQLDIELGNAFLAAEARLQADLLAGKDFAAWKRFLATQDTPQ